MRKADDEVYIRLKEWQISPLLTAIRLGLTLEDWCAESVYAALGVTDSDSPHWQAIVEGARVRIIKQTKTEEERTFGEANSQAVGALNRILQKEFKQWEEARIKHEQRELKKQARV